MKIHSIRNWSLGIGALAAAVFLLPVVGSAGDDSDAIADALSAAWPGMAESATVVDWEGNVLREGSNAYTCLPTPPMLSGTAPMCMDGEWMEWADAWANRKEYAPDALGISYMLAGDAPISNITPAGNDRPVAVDGTTPCRNAIYRDEFPGRIEIP